MYSKREMESIAQFNKWAPTYEQGIWSGYFDSVYLTVLQIVDKYLKSSSIILDLGCGTGKLEFLLSDRLSHGKVIGLDISPAMIKEAEDKKTEKFKNVIFTLSQANNLPYDDDTFDVVFSLNSLHHFPDHKLFFEEASRVLKTGGRFILLDLIKDNFVRRAWIEIIKIIFREKDVEFHTIQEIKSLAAQASLVIEEQKRFWYFTRIIVLKKH